MTNDEKDEIIEEMRTEIIALYRTIDELSIRLEKYEEKKGTKKR